MTAMSAGRRRQIQVDTIGFLANNLRGYEPTSILREQLQNADDASSAQGRSGELSLRFLPDRLVVTNPSVFNDEDWDRLTKPNSRGKFGDANQTGEFGVGFWGSLHLTDAPVVTSGGWQMTLDPRDAFEQLEVPYLDGTRVEFVYRRSPTELGAELDAGVIAPATEVAMADTFLQQMSELLLFTRAIDSILIELPDGTKRRAKRRMEKVVEGVDRLIVSVEGAPDEACDYLLVRSTVASPPPGRHDRVTVALPISRRHRGPGRAFFMFPTETDSGLCLSVDAHFRATDDRRSLENSGEHGAWNDRIFEAAGDAVGRALEVVFRKDVHGLPLEDAYGWFASSGVHQGEIAHRAARFVAHLDAQAQLRAVIPDRTENLRRGSELVDLPFELQELLGDVVGESALPVARRETRELFRRWGLVAWGPPEVARWLRGRVPHMPTKQSEAEGFLRRSEDALALLDYCKGQDAILDGVAMLLGTDGAYHPIGGKTLHKATPELAHLVEGLNQPLVSQAFLRSWPAFRAPLTTPQWLRSALIGATDKLVGKRVPIRGVGAAEKQAHVLDAIRAVRRATNGIAGVPLALDEDNTLRVFNDHIVVGLPDAGRKNAERLARRLGFVPLHRVLDEEGLNDLGLKFSVNLINEATGSAKDWDPIGDSRLLVEVLSTIAAEGVTSTALIEQLRSHRIWAGSDGSTHTLHELRLPSRDRIMRSSFPLVAERLLGEVSPSAPVYATLKGLLRVDVLDSTEETVIACEDPPVTTSELRELLFELADCDSLSKPQVERLKASAFVLCRDGQRRRPQDVVLALDDLPLGLGDRSVDPEAGVERKVRQCLGQLGAADLPHVSDLVDVAAAIADLQLGGDHLKDPGRVLWDFLERVHEQYPDATLGLLGDIPWLVAEPGPKRYKPRHCYDPNLSYAKLHFPVPVGVRSPHQNLRKALGIRESLDTEDCIKLAHKASELGHSLPAAFFREINRRCERGVDDARRLARLRSLPIVPTPQRLVAPERLVSSVRAEVWGHLRAVVPDQFVAEYPALLSAWGITVEGTPGWQEHLDVLKELAAAHDLGRREHALALERLSSIAELPLDQHQLETVFRQGFLLTSLGLRSCSETLRRDMVPAIIERLEGILPIAEESSDLVGLLDRLDVRSLRQAITLDAVVDGIRFDERWPQVFQTHSSNVVRFLKLSSMRLDEAMLEAWPPTIKSVTSLVVRASIDDQHLCEWQAGAHIANEGSDLVLYVSADTLDSMAVVDAIAYAFGVDRGKSALLNVLRAPSAQEGGALLDWEQIPRLTERETSLLEQHEEVQVVIEDEPEVSQLPDNRQLVVEAERATSPGAEPPPLPASQSTVQEAQLPQSAPAVSLVDGLLPEPDTVAGPTTLDLLDDIQSPRGVTHFEELEDTGIEVVRDAEPAPPEDDYEPRSNDVDDTPAKDEVRVVLSFVDVRRGFVPVASRAVSWLTSGVALREVEIFGETIAAEVVDQRHIRLAKGAELFHARQVVPGTVLRLFASTPGRIEIVVRPDAHRINGVWMLELDEDGKLNRLEQRNIELQWETDDAFYRAERRKEDIEALMADTGKSAVNLIIDVFLSRPGEGLTVDEIWGLVAINRLFAKSTIAQTLSYQNSLFTHTGSHWFMTGNQLKMPRATVTAVRPREQPVGRPQPSSGTEAMKLATKLAHLLPTLGEETLGRIIQRLGIRSLLADAEFARACDSYLATGDSRLLQALESDIRRDPGRSMIAAERLGGLDTRTLAARADLLEIVRAEGTAAAVSRALEMLTRLESVSGDAGVADPIDAATQLLEAFKDGAIADVQMWESVCRMWQQRRWGDPQDDATGWLDGLVTMENIHRDAAKTAEASAPAAAARNEAIGWLLAQLPAAMFDAPDVQRLRVVLDLLRAAESTEVLDGLYQLALLAENTPDGAFDARLLYALVCAHAARVRSTARIVELSRLKLASLASGVCGDTTEKFVEQWCNLARISMEELQRRVA